MSNIKKHLYTIASAVALSCCFSCNNAKPEPQPEPLKESTTTVVAKNVEADDVIKFEYKGEDDFMVDWGDQSTIDEHNTSHTYDGTVTSPVVTITGTFSEIRFSDEGWVPFESNAKVIDSVELGEGIVTIPDFAFRFCDAMTSVIVPKSVKTIGEQAFWKNIIYCRSESQPASWYGNWYCGQPYYFDYVSHNEKDLAYNYVITHKGVIISKYKGADTEVKIPEQIDELDVIGIGARSFNLNNNITKVELPDAVEFINDHAFYKNSSLKNIKLPKNLKTINGYAFSECALTSITLPDCLESIGEGAFSDCGQLASINLPNSLITIGDTVLCDCDKLEEITIPKTIKKVGGGAFSGCDNLTIYCEAESKPKGWHDEWNPDDRPCYWGHIAHDTEDGYKYIVTGKGTTIIKYTNPSSLTNVVVPPQLGGADVVAIDNEAFMNLDTIESIILPSKLVSIGDFAFANCKKLKEIVIPKTVAKVGYKAFVDCYNLIIYCRAESKPKGWADEWNFDNKPCYWGYIRHGEQYPFKYIVTSKGSTIVSYNDKKAYASVDVPRQLGGANVIAIASNAFSDCNAISIYLPDTLKSIGDNAFHNCYQLKIINLPHGLETIRELAFDYCPILQEICIPKSVKTIGYGAFLSCNNLTIYCEATEKPEDWAEDWNPDKRPYYFGYVNKDITDDGLDYITFTSGTIIRKYVGDSDTVVIPSILGGAPVVAIADRAFEGSNVVSVSLPDTLKSIGSSAFSTCNNLATINLPQGLESIGEAAFKNLLSLKELIIPSSVKTVSQYAIADCYNLNVYCEAKEKPDGWDDDWNFRINHYYFDYILHGNEGAFDYVIQSSGATIIKHNVGDTYVVVPEQIGGYNVISIDTGAFYNDSLLSYVKLPKTLKSIGINAFRFCADLQTVDLTAFTNWFAELPAEIEIFSEIGDNCIFEVASQNMAIAFSLTKGWPDSLDSYHWVGK